MVTNVTYRLLPKHISERSFVGADRYFLLRVLIRSEQHHCHLSRDGLDSVFGHEYRKMLRFAAVTVFGINSGGVAMITATLPP